MTTARDTGADSIEVKPVEGAEIAAFVDVFEAAWGFGSDDEQRQRTGSVVASETPLGAYVRGEMAGTAMSFSMELTVPGQDQMPMAGFPMSPCTRCAAAGGLCGR
jgi:hypothetical protein